MLSSIPSLTPRVFRGTMADSGRGPRTEHAGVGVATLEPDEQVTDDVHVAGRRRPTLDGSLPCLPASRGWKTGSAPAEGLEAAVPSSPRALRWPSAARRARQPGRRTGARRGRGTDPRRNVSSPISASNPRLVGRVDATVVVVHDDAVDEAPPAIAGPRSQPETV